MELMTRVCVTNAHPIRYVRGRGETDARLGKPGKPLARNTPFIATFTPILWFLTVRYWNHGARQHYHL